MSDEDLPLFAYKPKIPTRQQARAARDQALLDVEANARKEWLEQARETLLEYLRTHEEFFADDFWRTTDLEMAREPRAFGAVVAWAARSKFIVRTGEFRPSHNHCSPRAVWRSLIYNADQ